MSALVVVFDPSIRNGVPVGPHPNSGDEIISLSVIREVRQVYPEAEILRVSSHVRPTAGDIAACRRADCIILGGSNLLGNAVRSRRQPWKAWRQWDVSLSDARGIERAICLGVGWRDYERFVFPSTRTLFRSALASGGIHSARDEYTRLKIQSIGSGTSVNTGCPTLWPLAVKPSDWVSRVRSSVVLATVTNYRRDPESDARFIRLLQEAYEAVYLWPQGLGDGDYVRALGFRLNELGAGLGALDEFLREVHCDYVGTRLHGGIYCLNQGKRSLVLSVDNRAAEMCPEVGIPSVDRCDVGGIRQWVEDPVATTLTLNREAIDLWRGQFSE